MILLPFCLGTNYPTRSKMIPNTTAFPGQNSQMLQKIQQAILRNLDDDFACAFIRPTNKTCSRNKVSSIKKKCCGWENGAGFSAVPSLTHGALIASYSTRTWVRKDWVQSPLS